MRGSVANNLTYLRRALRSLAVAGSQGCANQFHPSLLVYTGVPSAKLQDVDLRTSR